MAEGDGEALRAEVERLTAALAAAERAAGARAGSLASIGHEIREPMNGVLGMARLLRDTPLDAEQRGYVEALIESAEALLALINDLLDLSRIDAGRLELAAIDFELGRFAERFERMVAPRARQKGLDFTVELAPGTPDLVRGDPGRLRQVLLNLVGNALKFTEEGRIAVELAPAPAPQGRIGLRVQVRDTGIGIPEGMRERLFRPFEQGDCGVARAYGGSGLGLVIARRLAEAMGGTIACTSGVESGTVFTVILALDEPAVRDGRRPRGLTSLAGASLLVIDPERRSRDTVRQLAGSWGMTVRTAVAADQAWALMEEAADRDAPFDIVLVDGSLCPGRGGRLGGFALGRRLRADSRLAHASLVMLVASGLRGDAARAQAAGFDAYLPKPVTGDTLLECLLHLRAPSRDPKGELITVHSISERRGRPLKVLVADDNPVNCRLASIVLERAGHEVRTVANGAAAVAALAAEPFDIVLMDLQMPVMGGIEATMRIRALTDRRRAAVPIVAVTASGQRGEDARCRLSGMDGYLRKPLDGATLLAAIERHRHRREKVPGPDPENVD
jgi:two-component system sensor histidine kinase/response regulator